MYILNLIVIPLSVTALIAYILTPFAITFAKRYGLVDDPVINKHPKVIHTKPIPRAGGISIFFSILLAILVFLPLDHTIVSILVGALLLLAIGVPDDKYQISPYHRFFIQGIAASIPVISGIGIEFITNPFGGIIDLNTFQYSYSIIGQNITISLLADLFAIVWIVFVMNMVNMGAKGIDGQMPGVVFIAAIVIAIVSLHYSADLTEWPVTLLASITAGAYLGFLPWNYYPQKIMPAFSGSMIAGYFLALLSILSTAKVGTLLVVLGIPIIDTIYTMMRRVYEGRSPVWGDRKHLHHRLLDSGLSKKTVTHLYWIGTAILGLLALNLKAEYKFYTIIGVALIIGGLLIWLTYRLKSSD